MNVIVNCTCHHSSGSLGNFWNFLACMGASATCCEVCFCTIPVFYVFLQFYVKLNGASDNVDFTTAQK